MRGQGGGPKTAKGKAASSRDALKHGLRSDAPIIPGLESFDEWERHRAGFVASFEPEGGFETFLAERIASLAWRLKRVPRYETEMSKWVEDTDYAAYTLLGEIGAEPNLEGQGRRDHHGPLRAA
jgi:hypothetical protein